MTHAESNRDSAFPTIPHHYSVSGCRIKEHKHMFYPIRHHEGEGFPHGDPYGDILGAMLGSDDEIVVLQVVFKPARGDWTQNGPDGRSVDDVAADLREGEVTGFRDPLFWLGLREMEERPPSKKDKDAAREVESQRGKQGFHVNVRVMAATPDTKRTEERARGVGNMFANFYSTHAEQRLVPRPIRPTATDIDTYLTDMITREWYSMDIILSIDELAGIAHIPNAEIRVPQIQWRKQDTGDQVGGRALQTQDPDAAPTHQQSPDTAPAPASSDQSPQEEDRGQIDDSHLPGDRF